MNLEDKLKLLDYSQAWLDSGILDIDTLNAQVKAYQKTQDDCLEHYRYCAFATWLCNTKHATQKQIAAYIKLALSDADHGMGVSAIIELIKVAWLTDEQFASIASMQVIKEKIPEELNKAFIIRALSTETLAQGLFEKAMRLNHSGVQHKLLAHKDLSKAQIKKLAQHGASKKIRNIASQLLNSKRYR